MIIIIKHLTLLLQWWKGEAMQWKSLFSAKVSQPQPWHLQARHGSTATRTCWCNQTWLPNHIDSIRLREAADKASRMLQESHRCESGFGRVPLNLPNVLILTLCFFCIARVGKTSISLRFVHNKFDKEQMSTVDASFLDKKVNVGERSVKLNIWDTAG